MFINIKYLSLRVQYAVIIMKLSMDLSILTGECLSVKMTNKSDLIINFEKK